jgi:hydrogenase maturation protease
MPRVLVIGYGNPLRADDGVGWHAARALERAVRDDEIQVLACHQLTPDLAANLSITQTVIFIDARCGGEPGSWTSQAVRPQTVEPGSFSHSCDPHALLAWARSLYGNSPQAMLISVCGESFAYGEGLSASVLARMPALLTRMRKIIAQARQGLGLQEEGLDA